MNKLLAKKVRLIEKLKSCGYANNKSLASLEVKDILKKFDGISIADLKMILEIQEAVKSNALYSFLCADEEIEKETEEC